MHINVLCYYHDYKKAVCIREDRRALISKAVRKCIFLSIHSDVHC